MPKVGGKHFSYSKKGKAAAKAFAKRTGKRLVKSKKKPIRRKGY